MTRECLAHCKESNLYSKTKHIGVQYHFIKEVVKNESVDMQKIHTKDNLADVMTKSTDANKLAWC